MTPPDSDELLITRLHALPEAERAAEVERMCTGDTALRARMPGILAALAGPGNSTPATAHQPLSPESMVLLLNSALEVAPSEVPGVRIGPYKLLQEIGRGGFGVVWMVEQEEPIRRRVALKIIKAGMDTKEVIARFEAERQALALMDHPNIAHVFDAGATEAGRPYFVMELVRGVAITRYCDETRLPAEKRLQLFMAVCQAVQHAHQKGVIHRDLKPSNILVTLHDGVPVPKIIDFGIAKATGGARLTDKTLFTQFHAFIGTPAYTSPEQMEMSGLDVDTRSDIYSLGVLLYELLAGRQPFDADALIKSGLEAMRRTIREIDPPRPSHRLTTLTDEERTSVAQQRGTDAGKLSLLLRGDLDWIVMRCMEKERTRRYETANGLAMDIRRYLASEPVEARPPSQTYRFRKFIRRHKLGFAAAMAVAVSLVGGLVVSSVLFVRERAAHAHSIVAEQAEGRLRQQADAARKLETKNASRTALDLAGQLLEKGQTADALAYLVHAARKDPANLTIAPRLTSVLTSHNFLIPEGAPFQCGSRVLAMRYAKDGRSLEVGTEDGTFRIFDAASGAVLREIHLGQRVKRGDWAFARDNDTGFAVRFADNTVGVIDAGSGRPRWSPTRFEVDFKSDAGMAGGLRVGLSPDARWLYVHGLGACKLVDAATGESRLDLSFARYHFGPEFSPDGRRLVFVFDDAVHMWSLPECVPFREPMPVQRTTTPGVEFHPKFSPDGKNLVICDPWEGIHVLDAATAVQVRFWPWVGEQEWHTLGFLPDGRLFSAADHAAQVLDINTGHATPLPFFLGGDGQIAASADGKFLATVSDDGYPRLWDARSGQLVAEATFHQSDKFLALPSPDGTQLALATGEGVLQRLRVGRGAAQPLVWPGARMRSGTLFLGEPPVRLFGLTDDGTTVIDVASGRITGGGPGVTPQALPKNTPCYVRPDLKFILVRNGSGREPSQVWKLAEGRVSRITTLQADPGSPAGSMAVPFSREGNLVAHAVSMSKIQVWDLQTGLPVGPGCSYEGRTLFFIWSGLDFSPDGQRLAGGTIDGTVVVWDVATGRVTTKIETHADVENEQVVFSPDGTRILTVNGRHEARLWDAGTGEPRSPIIYSTDMVNGGFSSDGRWFVTWGNSAVGIWDGRTGGSVCKLKDTGARCCRFSADGKRIVTIDIKGNTLVWDVRTGQPLTAPMHQPNSDWIEDFSPDGRFVEVYCDGPCLWAVPPALREGSAIPEWLLQLATICATKTVNDAGQCVDAPEEMSRIDDVRRQLAALPGDAPLVEWGRWFLDDSSTRSIAPGFTITPDEAAKLSATLASSPASSP